MHTLPWNVLFVCTGNSARSIMAEVIMNQLGSGRFKAYSAGFKPRGSVHPMTLDILARQRYPVDGLRSKSWQEFLRDDAPRMDFIFTVCDQAAGELCPVWPGQPITAHWGFSDPAALTGTHEQQFRAFFDVQQQIANRVKLFISLPFHKLDRLALHNRLRDLGC